MHPNHLRKTRHWLKTTALKQGTGLETSFVNHESAFGNHIVILPIWLNHRGKTPPWFNEQTSSHKFLLESLNCAYTFPC